MPAFIQNINPTELVLIAVVAILIFGRRLPEVAGQVAGRVQQARRAFNDLKRETGIDEELRQAKRTFDQSVHDARYAARKDPAAPTIEPPSAGGRVGRGAPGDESGELRAIPDPAAPPVGGPSDGVHGGEASDAAGADGGVSSASDGDGDRGPDSSPGSDGASDGDQPSTRS